MVTFELTQKTALSVAFDVTIRGGGAQGFNLGRIADRGKNHEKRRYGPQDPAV